MSCDSQSTTRAPPPGSHFDGLALRAAATLSPGLAARWRSAWACLTPGDLPPGSPWLGAAPQAFAHPPPDPERLDPRWDSFRARLASGRSAHPEPALDWLGAFWLSLCLLPNPLLHLASHPLARARLAEMTRAIHHFSLVPHAHAHDAWLGFARPLALGLGVARDPPGALLLFGRLGPSAFARSQSVEGWTAACRLSLADRLLAELLAPFLHGSRDGAWRSVLMSRMSKAAWALLNMGATAPGVAACLGDRACLAWLSSSAPASSAPGDNRLWRSACSAAFGSGLPLFAQGLFALGADHASKALGPTFEEIERAALLTGPAPNPNPTGHALVQSRL